MRGAHSTLEIDSALRKVAQPQLGLVTVAQASEAGVDKFALERRRKSGALVPVFADVMRLGAAAPTAEQRILGASLSVSGSTVAATSAAVVHQMPVTPGDDQPIVSVGATRSARSAGITTIRQTSAMPSQRWFTTRLATPCATIVLLPRFAADATVERCLDYVLAHRLTSVSRVSGLIEHLPTRAVVGRRLLLDLLAQRSSGIGHRSGLEQQVGRWLNDAGLRGWQRNHRAPVGGRRSVEVDFAWTEAKIALEVSPFFTHGSRATQERDVERRRLLVPAGWRVVEATDPDLESQQAFDRVVASLTRLLTSADMTSRALSSFQSYSTHDLMHAATHAAPTPTPTPTPTQKR